MNVCLGESLPWIGWITNKLTLSMCGLSFIPKAFKIPEHKVQFLEYVSGLHHVHQMTTDSQFPIYR